MVTIGEKGATFYEPENIKELEAFCSGDVSKNADVIALDSLTAMTRTFIKDYALTFPRGKGQTLKRAAGVPELDDYGVMAEITRRLLAKLISLNKHVIVTTTLKLPQDADPDNGRDAQPAMPDLPGQLALAATAMFDTVFIMRTRPVLRDPKEARSRYTQRYLMTQQTDKWLAKSRLNASDRPILAEEEIFDKDTGQGSFPDILAKIQKAYAVQV